MLAQKPTHTPPNADSFNLYLLADTAPPPLDRLHFFSWKFVLLWPKHGSQKQNMKLLNNQKEHIFFIHIQYLLAKELKRLVGLKKIFRQKIVQNWKNHFVFFSSNSKYVTFYSGETQIQRFFISPIPQKYCSFSLNIVPLNVNEKTNA